MSTVIEVYPSSPHLPTFKELAAAVQAVLGRVS